MKRFLWHWLPPLAWMGLIFVLSAQPDLPHIEVRWLDLLLKKAGHAVAYGVLAWLYRRALRRHILTGTVLRAVSIGLAVAYAASDEYHQTFVPGRNGNLVDVAVDGVGACGAMLLARWREGRRELPRPESVVR
ncbi:MAG: VanZ family protein [Anaerolineae bacterium]|nr:VanZ family protein [Anaerolineae bacterium]